MVYFKYRNWQNILSEIKIFNKEMHDRSPKTKSYLLYSFKNLIFVIYTPKNQGCSGNGNLWVFPWAFPQIPIWDGNENDFKSITHMWESVGILWASVEICRNLSGFSVKSYLSNIHRTHNPVVYYCILLFQGSPNFYSNQAALFAKKAVWARYNRPLK